MRSFLLATAAAALISGTVHADPWHDKARAMLEHAVNIPTVIGRGKVPELANYFADQFRQAGWPEGDIHVMPYETKGDVGTPTDHTAALIVRWRAQGHPKQKPIMLMGHMDVVEAKKEDWATSDPFVFTEKDNYYYGRGTIDM
ncbi:MAG: M20/M25/M40 family metallo-hydrolase, partial [Alphaproteobacteria bacterium]|nr:M20/M25/M40 family metallo-hydrolase [Alphaproteobacteria bacterium]